MAITFQSAIIPHHPDLHMATPASMKLSPVFAISGHRREGGELREFTGLKLQSPSKKTLASLLRHPRRTTSRPLQSRRRGIACEAQGTVLEVPTVTDATWKSLVLKADGLVLVEFFASWCGPCRIIDTVVTELSQQYEGKVKFYKLNTDESPSIATKYGIRSIPTIMILNKGEKKDSIMGAVPKTMLTASIEKFL